MRNLVGANKSRLETYERRLKLYYDAEEKILEGQSITIGSRTLTMASLAEVRKTIQELEAKVNALKSRGTTKRKVARIIPRDL